jgi:hypothetical protein
MSLRCHWDGPILVSAFFGGDLESHLACQGLVLGTKPLYSIYLGKLIVKETYNEEKTPITNYTVRNRLPTLGPAVVFSNQELTAQTSAETFL